MTNDDALLAALRAALRGAASPHADAPLLTMPDKGLAHHHVRLGGCGVVARLPKQSQLGLAAQANLDYQATCFARAAASGHVPMLLGVLPPSAPLPRGGLLVQDIVGRPARLPQDLPAIATALAAIHSLALPEPARRPPLLDPPDPLAALKGEIDAQAQHLDAAGVPPASRRLIDRALADFAACVAARGRPPRRLISFDAHPGNFLVGDDGRAVLVDLEKARYSHPPLDLAHATLYTSTTWDLDSCAELSLGEVLAAYDEWQRRIDDAAPWRAWHAPLRAAMWLWAVTWCAKWRVLSEREAGRGGDGEDWSRQHSDAALVRHVRDRVETYLSPAVVAVVYAELEAVRRAFAA